jgi:acetoin:2,6-dichlorophenolindophenol oxidoreductase subunit alpha
MRKDPALDDATRVDLLRMMVLLRTFYERMRREADAVGASQAGKQRLPGGSGRPSPAGGPPRRGGMRVSLLGCEPMAAGFGVHLTLDDSVTSPRQPHYLAIARGIDLRCVVNEAIGATHGHQRPDDSDNGERQTVPGHRPSGPSAEGAGYLPALGRAFAYQRRGSDRVAVAILGQTIATEDGFQSAIQLAGLWKLPVVFVLCTDRLVAAPEPGGDPIGGDAAGYGIPTVRVPSVAVEDACMAAGRAIRRARSGEGPSLVEVQTMWAGPSDNASDQDGVEDPLTSYERALRGRGLVDDELIAQIRAEATYLISDSLRQVVNSHREGPNSCPLCAQKAVS